PAATYPLSLHDALPIFPWGVLDGHNVVGGFLHPIEDLLDPLKPLLFAELARLHQPASAEGPHTGHKAVYGGPKDQPLGHLLQPRSEEHTSELQSRENLV